jgi:TRAP-type C4-dicarboxylate transport system substrate-binding protein
MNTIKTNHGTRTRLVVVRVTVLLGFTWMLLPCAQAYAQTQTRLRLATLIPSGTSYHHGLQEMGAKWKQASGGALTLTIYADGTMGSEAETVRRMRVGQLQAALLTVDGLSEVDPSVSALQKMPLMFHSLDEVAYVRTRLAPELNRRLAEKGFVVLFWADAGWVRFFSKEPASSPDDFKKMKIFVSAGDNDQPEVMKAAGYHPVSLEWSDALTSLQTGMIDALPTVPLHALTSQFHLVTHHMLEVNWLPLVGALVITKKSWDSLPAETREAMAKAAEECGQQFQSKGHEENQEAVDAMKKRGLQVHPVSPEEEARWRQFSETLYPAVRGRIVPAEMFDEVVQILREYRAGQGKGEK